MATQQRKRKKQTNKTHDHFFIVPSPDGSETLTAVCRECGVKKEVFATDAHWDGKDWNRARDIKSNKSKTKNKDS